ncbi:ATP-binding protein [Kitasatospora sp. NPDC057542]|uniref:ATP-binding protein n=1 Tax=Streptomycetaceae TaxID=2062 RepID=UPI001CCB6258|nr:ATP-binding protein [Streptomyces sp. LS1784]
MGWNVIVSPLSNARFPVPLEWEEPPGAGAVPTARRLVVAIVREWGVPLSEVALQELELCASEVIANALVHAGERCAVTIRWHSGRVRVEVADRGAELPGREREEEATSGRGLMLVEALADVWGWHPTVTGKVVWFEYPETREAPCPTFGWGAAVGLRTAGQPKKVSRICWAAKPAGRVPART